MYVLYFTIILIVREIVVEKENRRVEKNKDCKNLYEQIVVAIGPVYRWTWINIRNLWSNFMVFMNFVYIYWMVCLQLISFFVMHLFQCVVYAWFHVECMKSVRGKVWVSIVSHPENSCKECVNEFWVLPQKISGEISLFFIPVELQV